MTQKQLDQKRYTRQMRQRKVAKGIARDKHVFGPQKRAQKAEARRLMSHFLLTQNLAATPPDPSRAILKDALGKCK